VDNRSINRDFAPLKTISGEVKNKHHDIPSRRNGVSKGKGKISEGSPGCRHAQYKESDWRISVMVFIFYMRYRSAEVDKKYLNGIPFLF